MPGFANYKTLYKEEYNCLRDEGYDVESFIQPSPDAESFLPIPDETDGPIDKSEGELWRRAYNNLIKVRSTPIRKDYPYDEPNEYDEIMKRAEKAPELIPLSDEEYKNRLKGAFYGRCAAVILGKPLEMGLSRQDIKEYLESVSQYPLNDFAPEYSEKLGKGLREDCVYSTKGNVKFAQADDDINYTLLALRLAEAHPDGFSRADVGYNWLDNISYHWCWCASRQAYFNLVSIDDTKDFDEQINEIPYKYNPWRECIDGQIRTDMWGYIHPADIKAAAYDAHRDCSFSLTKNGIYGGMFVAGAIAGAMSREPSVDLIIKSGLSAIPKRSRLYETVTDVCSWWEETHDWVMTCDKIYEKYGHLPFAATLNNMAIVTLGIVAGELDYTKSITIAAMAGIDTDCNAGTVGSIIGAALGIDKIPARWYEPLNDTIKSTVAAFGECKISEIIERIEKIKEKGYHA